MNIKEVARLTKISVRTLHHYDTIGLLSPYRNPENDYREYSDEDLYTLQQILTFRACGFPLKSIRNIMSSESYNKLNAIDIQTKYLLHEREKIDKMISTLKKTKKHIKGEINMSNKEKFKGFDFRKNPYEDEARALWGDKAVDGSKKHIENLDDNQLENMQDKMNSIFARTAELMDKESASSEVQNMMREFYQFLNTNTGHKYSLEAFAGLGQMYIQDERFTENIDMFRKGLSSFMAEGMDIYSKNQ